MKYRLKGEIVDKKYAALGGQRHAKQVSATDNEGTIEGAVVPMILQRYRSMC